jgi:tryptophan-rich sensory protein
LAVRSRLDSAVFPDGSLGVARVATRRLARLTGITWSLWIATHAQRGLVGHFFGMRSPGWAFGEILILLLAIAATAVSFWGRSATAALLFAPYLAWTAFAALLNFAIWRMNS